MGIDMAEKKMNFEKSLARLEEIVKSLEKGDAPLDESLKLFEEGTALIASCGKMLDDAEQKVVKLRKGADGEPVETPFDGAE
jgi:exodeoxyribonuclease VII small subunit